MELPHKYRLHAAACPLRKELGQQTTSNAIASSSSWGIVLPQLQSASKLPNKYITTVSHNSTPRYTQYHAALSLCLVKLPTSHHPLLRMSWHSLRWPPFPQQPHFPAAVSATRVLSAAVFTQLVVPRPNPIKALWDQAPQNDFPSITVQLYHLYLMIRVCSNRD